MIKNSFYNIPNSFIVKWQEIADLLATILNIPAALIMKTENDFMEVFISSKTENNPYHVGDKEHWHGLYCETVIKSQQKLLISNALNDEKWSINPDIKLGMIAYLGFPLNFPDNQPFGTICVLDNKEHLFSETNEKIIAQFKNVLELDLALIQHMDLNINGSDFNLTTQILNQNTELQKAKEKAEESEKIYRLLYEFNPMPMSIFDIETLNFLSVNNAFVEKYGYTHEEFLDMTILDIRPESEIEKLKQTVRLPDKGLTNLGIYVHRKKDGEIIQVEIIRHELIFNNKKAKLVLINDVTDKIKAENDLILTNAELTLSKEKAEESDRLKTAFLQNMSHEIRTPLNAISGFSGMLSKPELSKEKSKSFISIIQNSSKQLISIVSDILTISSLETKQETTNIEKVCINNIIVDLLAIFKQQAQNQNISIYAKQQLSDKQSEIYTDKTKIIQIITNLLSNAFKFTHEGFIEFGYNLKENEFEFYVKDSGIGIKPEFHEKIFERFRQADKSINKLYGGTGLGLAISKAFVELLGGNIWVKSEHEKGSTFYFTIPYKPANENDKTKIHTKQNENFKTILVAEDEEYNFLFIEELLIDLDLKLIHAKDGRETVEVFKSNPKIDLILMDIKMPIMTGYEAAKIIKELKPDLPIVAQSAYALEHERAKYEGIFDDYLTKPIDENVLKQMVMKYIDIIKK